MLAKRTNRISRSTLNFAARFIWNDHKSPKRPDDEALADALNLLSKPTSQHPKYKPSLLKSLTGNPMDEQLSNVNQNLHVKHESHINERFVNNLLWGIKSSLLDSGINHSQLLNMTVEELSSYIKRIKNEDSLRDIVQVFLNNDKLKPRILTDILLNKSLKSLDNFPVDLSRFEDIAGIDERGAIHLKIIMLKKYYDLNQPLNIVRNLKLNFAACYLPLIQIHQLTPFYERIVWRFVFEYLRQYNEEHYIKSLRSLQSSFLIWESSSYTSSQTIARLILENHGEMTHLQVLFFKIASITRTSEVPKLRRISIKHKLYQGREDRKTLYAVLYELDNFLMSSRPEQAKSLLEELAVYRLEIVQGAYSNPVNSVEGLQFSKT